MHITRRWMSHQARLASVVRTLTFHPSIRYLNSTVLTGFVILIINLGSGIILARSLGASSRGFVAAAMLWPPLLAGLAGLSVADALLIRAARSEAALASALPTAMLIGACESLVAMACGWIVLPRVLGGMSPEVVTISRYYLLYIPLTYTVWFITAVLQARGYRFNVFRASTHVAYTALLLFLWLIHLIGPLTVIAASLGAHVITVAIGIILVRGRGWWHVQVTWAVARELLNFGYRVHIGTVASFLTARLDLVILAILVPPAELGNYVVSGIPGAALTLIPLSASMVAYPAVVRMRRDAVPATIARCFAVFALMMLLAFLVDLTLPLAIPFFFGPGYQPAIRIGQILTFGLAIRSTTGLLGAVVRGLSRPLSAGLGDIVGLPMFAILLLVLVPRWQGIGAGIALSAAAGLGFAVMLVVNMRATGMTPTDFVTLWRNDAARLSSVIQARSAPAS